MIRDIFSNKLVLGVFGSLILISFFGCYFWYQHDLERFQRQFGGIDVADNQPEIHKKSKTTNDRKIKIGQIEERTHKPNEGMKQGVVEKLKRTIISDEIRKGPLANLFDRWQELHSVSNQEFDTYSENMKAGIMSELAIYAEEGIESPPPPGYRYSRKNANAPWELIRLNEPRIETRWEGLVYGQLHQLSDAEFERYKALEAIVSNPDNVDTHLIQGGHAHQILAYPIEVIELAREWYNELREKTRGPALKVSVNISYDHPPTPADDQRNKQLIKEAREAASPTKRDNTIDYNLVNQILNQIERELGITIERETQATKISRDITQSHTHSNHTHE